MKHGPIALIDREMPVVVLATKNEVYEKVLSNIEEVKAREGKVIALASPSDREIVKKVDDVILIPETLPSLTPILLTIPFNSWLTIWLTSRARMWISRETCQERDRRIIRQIEMLPNLYQAGIFNFKI